MIRMVQAPPVMAPSGAVRDAPRSKQDGFAEVFAQTLSEGRDVRFSAHAAQRLADRDIRLSVEDTARINRAVDEAAARGARDSLLLMDRLAFVVSVRNRTVITAMPVAEMGSNVFTNIDSAVVVPATASSRGTTQPGPDPTWGGPGAAE